MDFFKLEEFTDDNSKVDPFRFRSTFQAENIVGKGEIARFEQFLLFPQCFPTPMSMDT